jgi:hypothetical protein
MVPTWGPAGHENGGKSVEYRKQLGAMFAGAARREFDLLLVWSLDRFSREGMAATIGHLQRLSSHGASERGRWVRALGGRCSAMVAGRSCKPRSTRAGAGTP